MHPGWGDKMNELFVECDKRSIPWRGLSGSGFCIQMNEITKASVPGDTNPEVAAETWLNALRNPQ